MLPNFFIAHGSPMNAIESNYFTDDWHNITQSLKQHPKPNSIVVISAHWETQGTWISSNEAPPTIHDFQGFPQALHDCQYPCPGNTALAMQMQSMLAANNIECGLSNSWGLDHGSWTILKHLYPQADIPVFQISLDRSESNLYKHYDIAQALKSLRNEGVLFIGSGNIVHNISKWMSMQPGHSIEWASSFDEYIATHIQANNFEAIAQYQTQAFAKIAVPTPEHFLPLIYNLGLSGNEHYQWDSKKIQSSRFHHNDLSTACSRSLSFK